ncbi:hypothetical protein ACFOTA_21645 [Chitinophaga sp. GCM10012297]|uniref:DUF4369 domain-containing protein n=1 Tax=Chitinophaga chungangae TaxID=2821488 RepID=A0ABS3YJG5_9BACT|nr:hypothetical protein [Chitinophaga chungangae]MBO9154833.1 hypothetical protein [Chitinophaga chungangae]
MDWTFFVRLVAACLFLSVSNNATSQVLNRYSISFQLEDIKDGTSVYLLDKNGQRKTEGKFVNNKCILQSTDSLPGTPVLIKLETLPDTKYFVLGKDEHVQVTGRLADWPWVSVSGGPLQNEYNDYQATIQAPFTAELKRYEAVMIKVTGTKKRQEWVRKANQLNGKDSLDAVFAKHAYEMADLLYRKNTLGWILLNPQSYYTPLLILKWCPKEAWKNAYQILSPEVKVGFYGERLRMGVENKLDPSLHFAL